VRASNEASVYRGDVKKKRKRKKKKKKMKMWWY
jgi:hypothetical protein